MQAGTLDSDGALNPILQMRTSATNGTYVAFWRMCRNERVEMLKAGVPTQLLGRLIQEMQVSRKRLSSWVGLSPRRSGRNTSTGRLLSMSDAERVLGIARLIGQIETVVSESGELTGFNAAEWTACWLGCPNNALGHRCPGDFMDTADGRELISGLVAQFQSGAYA